VETDHQVQRWGKEVGKKDKMEQNDSVSIWSGILFSLETRLKVKQLAGPLYIGERICDLNGLFLFLCSNIY